MALAMLALLSALAGGVVRLGWSLPVASSLAVFHGPLMVAGFLGTVIGLERAVALGRWWVYGAPIASGLGVAALIGNMPAGAWLMAFASATTVVAGAEVVRRQPTTFTVVMGLGALSWLGGQIAWLAGQPIHRVVLWWVGFLVLTIVGERLELTRFVRLGRAARATFVVAVAALLCGLAVTFVQPNTGGVVIGVALISLALWLAAFDIARRTARGSGLTRFIAVALLAGYAWLAVAGVLAVRGAGVAGPLYDATVHALFVGFVFSMIFGHAPIIFPAVVAVPIRYRPAFYAHLALLHASLVLRVVGDLTWWLPGRRWGGMLNAVAIMVFFANTAYSALRPPTR
jgi:hypothetical protein